MTKKRTGARVGRPRLPPEEKRVKFTASIDPSTLAGLDALAEHLAQNRGQITDRLVARELRRLRIEV